MLFNGSQNCPKSTKRFLRNGKRKHLLHRHHQCHLVVLCFALQDRLAHSQLSLACAYPSLVLVIKTFFIMHSLSFYEHSWTFRITLSSYACRPHSTTEFSILIFPNSAVLQKRFMYTKLAPIAIVFHLSSLPYLYSCHHFPRWFHLVSAVYCLSPFSVNLLLFRLNVCREGNAFAWGIVSFICVHLFTALFSAIVEQ